MGAAIAPSEAAHGRQPGPTRTALARSVSVSPKTVVDCGSVRSASRTAWGAG